MFVPPRETGFQAMIEGYNGLWQAKVWARFTFTTPEGVRQQSDRFVAAVRRVARSGSIRPVRRAFPSPGSWTCRPIPAVASTSCGDTDAAGAVRLLERSYAVDPRWTNRLVRAEFDLDAGKIRFYALRRKEPTVQPMLREIDHRLPRRKFRE